MKVSKGKSKTRKEKKHTYISNSLNQVMSASDGTSYTYDGNGNLTEKDENGNITQYEWDAYDKLKRVELPSGDVIQYEYNSEGIREKKINPDGSEVRYLMDELAVLCEYTGAETILTEYVPGVSMRKNNQTYYYITDRLGSVRYVLDSSGAVVNSYLYSPFGQIHTEIENLSQPYQYVGGEFYYTEEETGLKLLGQRWYDGEVGRFISRDPIGEEGGLNLYVYVGNNVMNEVDPEGRTAEEVVRDCKLGCDVYLSGPTLLTECCSSISEYVLEEIPQIDRICLKECYQECSTQKGNKPGAVISTFINCLSTKLSKDALIKLLEKILINTI